MVLAASGLCPGARSNTHNTHPEELKENKKTTPSSYFISRSLLLSLSPFFCSSRAAENKKKEKRDTEYLTR
jgi:hypothetical protein